MIEEFSIRTMSGRADVIEISRGKVEGGNLKPYDLRYLHIELQKGRSHPLLRIPGRPVMSRGTRCNDLGSGLLDNCSICGVWLALVSHIEDKPLRPDSANN